MRRNNQLRQLKHVNLLYVLSFYFYKLRIRCQIIFCSYNPEELLKKLVVTVEKLSQRIRRLNYSTAIVKHYHFKRAKGGGKE